MLSNSRHGTCYSYPIQLPVRYISNGREPGGEGRTLAISSESIRFECSQMLTVGKKIRLAVPWPASLPDGTGLNLWINGTVNRCAGGEAEVRIAKYEFRTRPHVQPIREVRQWGATILAGHPQVAAVACELPARFKPGRISLDGAAGAESKVRAAGRSD